MTGYRLDGRVGWAVQVCIVYDHRLDRHQVTLAADGSVTDRLEAVDDDLLEPESS